MIIGLYSPAMQSGKSTVANVLVEHGFYLASFAAPLKEMLVSLIGHQRVYDPRLKEEVIPDLGYSPRQLMQTLGTEWGRKALDEDFWVRLFHQRHNLTGKIVVDDVRFPNEAQYIKSQGGQVWRITRPDARITSKHISEGSLNQWPFDQEIVNEGTLEELIEKARKLVY